MQEQNGIYHELKTLFIGLLQFALLPILPLSAYFTFVEIFSLYNISEKFNNHIARLYLIYFISWIIAFSYNKYDAIKTDGLAKTINSFHLDGNESTFSLALLMCVLATIAIYLVL